MSTLSSFNVYIYYFDSQGILAIIPGFLLVGFAASPSMLYTGLLLYSFGEWYIVVQNL